MEQEGAEAKATTEAHQWTVATLAQGVTGFCLGFQCLTESSHPQTLRRTDSLPGLGVLDRQAQTGLEAYVPQELLQTVRQALLIERLTGTDPRLLLIPYQLEIK